MSNSKKEVRFYTHWEDEYWMSSNDFYCGLNMPEAIAEKGEHDLPPYSKRRAFLVDEYPACPNNWMRSEGKQTSYFVGIKKNNGLWLDFNRNSEKKHHVAMVISIQGVNPITGMPCSDAHLEQYINTCPKCKKTFGPKRYCKECGYKWPKQNYICSTATPEGMLWLDGFRTIDGVVRQYVLSEEKIKGVAAGIIGNKRVFAIGISFFLSKNPKPIILQPQDIRTCFDGSPQFYSPIHAPTSWDSKKYKSAGGGICCKATTSSATSSTSSSFSSSLSIYDAQETDNICYAASERGIKDNDDEWQIGRDRSLEISMTDELLMGEQTEKCIKKSINQVSTKKMEVGAGAIIRQAVYDDPEPLDYWRTEPEAILCINYALEEECQKIIEQGKIDLSGHKEGFLQKIPVAI